MQQTIKSPLKVVIEKQMTVEDLLDERKLSGKKYFVSRDGIMMQNMKETLKIGDTVSIIARVAGG